VQPAPFVVRVALDAAGLARTLPAGSAGDLLNGKKIGILQPATAVRLDVSIKLKGKAASGRLLTRHLRVLRENSYFRFGIAVFQRSR
jgi:hypothetical protein